MVTVGCVQQQASKVGLSKRTVVVAHAGKGNSNSNKAAAVALAASLMLGCGAPAYADYQDAEQFLRKWGAVPCSESRMFKKMQSKQIK